MPYAQLATIRLYYEEDGSGTPIALIHGTSSDADIWGPAKAELARQGRVIAYDRRGCTRSERPEPYAATSVSEQADDAAALLAALDAIPAVVVGRSYGGTIALDLATRYPDRVRALVLLEPGAFPLAPEVRPFMEGTADRVRRAVAEHGVGAVAEAVLRVVLHDEGWEALPAGTKARLAENGPAILAEMSERIDLIDPAEYARRLAQITQPTLVVAAASSPPPFRQMTDRLTSALPNARQVVVEGGHLITPADPRVVAFIREVIGKD
jgi:esterase